MSRGKKILAAVAIAFHLTLVASGAAYHAFSNWGVLGHYLDVYGAISGANSSYGFFAPEVGGQVRALFDITDAKGGQRSVNLQSGLNHESDLRVSGIMEEFATEDAEPELFQRALAASLAGAIFGRYPDSVKVRVSLEEIQPISMAEFRAGKRMAWRPFYDISFQPVVDRPVAITPSR